MIAYRAIFPFSFMLNQSLHLKLPQQRLFKATKYLFSHWSLVTTTTTKSQFYPEDNVSRSKTTCPRLFEGRDEYVTKFWSMMCEQNYCVGLSEGLLKWSWPIWQKHSTVLHPPQSDSLECRCDCWSPEAISDPVNFRKKPRARLAEQ